MVSKALPKKVNSWSLDNSLCFFLNTHMQLKHIDRKSKPCKNGYFVSGTERTRVPILARLTLNIHENGELTSP